MEIIATSNKLISRVDFIDLIGSDRRKWAMVVRSIPSAVIHIFHMQQIFEFTYLLVYLNIMLEYL